MSYRGAESVVVVVAVVEGVAQAVVGDDLRVEVQRSDLPRRSCVHVCPLCDRVRLM